MSDKDDGAPKANCSFSFKRRGGAGGSGAAGRLHAARHRKAAANGSSSSSSSGEEQAAVVRIEKRKKVNHMIQRSSNIKKFKVRFAKFWFLFKTVNIYFWTGKLQ